MARNWIRARDVIVVVLFLIVFFIGLEIGQFLAIKGMLYVASNFIELDYRMVERAIFQYENQIGGCYNSTRFEGIANISL